MRDAKMHSGVALFSGFLAFSAPVIAGAYWPLYAVSPEAASLVLRPLMVAISLVLALLWWKAPLTSAEARAACVLLAVAAGLFIPSVAAADPARSLIVWIKLLILCTFAFLLSRGLRHEGTANFLGAGLIVSALLVASFTLFTYVRFIGFVAPTYKLTREFKGIAEKTGIPLNAVPFTCAFSFLIGMSLLRANWLLWLTGLLLFLISSVFTGSRTPLALLIVSAVALALLNGFHSRRLSSRLLAYTIAAVIPLAIAGLVLQQPFRHMSSITEGRWDLWYVAIRKFAERPILGSGYDSWRDDLASMLPGAYPLTRYMAKNIVGGYHNEYLALLAEQGLVGFAAGMVLICFLFCLSWKAAFRRWNMRHNGQWVLFACIFLLLRAALEIPGLFGDGSEPADLLAYMFVAIAISRFSREEDFLKANTSFVRAAAYTDENTRPIGNARRPEGCDVPVGLDRSYV